MEITSCSALTTCISHLNLRMVVFWAMCCKQKQNVEYDFRLVLYSSGIAVNTSGDDAL